MVIILGISALHYFTVLQTTDVNHDARISALEENVGGSQNGNVLNELDGITTFMLNCKQTFWTQPNWTFVV